MFCCLIDALVYWLACASYLQESQSRDMHLTGPYLASPRCNSRPHTVCLSSFGCLLMQSIWTDGSSILSVGLDQRLRCWELRRSQQCCADSCAGNMPAADDIHSKMSADAMAHEAVLEIQEAESYATQVLEPAALHVVCRDAEHEQSSGWVVGVVGRGTELIQYTRTP